MVDVSGGLIWDRERVNWMDDMKVALGSIGMLMLAAQQFTKDRKGWRAQLHL